MPNLPGWNCNKKRTITNHFFVLLPITTTTVTTLAVHHILCFLLLHVVVGIEQQQAIAMLPVLCSRQSSSSSSSRQLRFLRAKSLLLVNNPKPRSWRGVVSSSSSSSSASPSLSQQEAGKDLEELEAEITRLNNGQKINVNSPKQVSVAVFGRVQSTNRTILKQAAEGKLTNLDSTQLRIASLVLNHRELSRVTLVPATSSDRKRIGRQVSTSTAACSSEPATSTAKPITHPLDSVLSAGDAYLSPYDRHVNSLFNSPKCILHNYWKEPLLQLTRPTAKALVYQLDSHICPMGFHPLAAPRDPLRRDAGVENTASVVATTTTTAGKKGSFLAYCRDQKNKYPDAITLVRCGDFYETYGIDAIMLVEHCGLNAMAGKAKAGCPIRNVQPTLDCLTARGFRVAVFEEASDTDASATRASGGSKSRIKNRFLAQIVSAASPTYLYDLVLLGNTDTLATAPPSRPHVGVLSLSSGYTLVEISVEEQSVRVSERLTAEGVACRLAAYPPADPLIYVPSMREYESSTDGVFSLPFLPSRLESSGVGPGCRLRTKVVPPSLVQQPRPGVSDIDRAKNTILSVLLRLLECRSNDDDGDKPYTQQQKKLALDDFMVLSSMASDPTNKTHTNPLYLETATQLGLMDDRAIPSLVSYLLPNSAPAATRRFLRRFLLTPPPPIVADAMRDLVGYLKDSSDSALPPLTVPPVGKVLALIRAGQASAEVYGEILNALEATVLVLDRFGDGELPIIESLMTLLEHESGLAADTESLNRRCAEAIEAIEDVISPIHHTQLNLQQDPSDCTSNFGNLIPEAFFERNEAPWRGRVRREASPGTYEGVEKAAQTLAETVAVDFWGFTGVDDDVAGNKNPIVQDIFNNLFALREIPEHAVNDDGAKSKYIHPRDRFGKLLRNRYTTEAVQDALSTYVDACERAKQDVTSVLISLSQRLHDQGHLPAIVQGSHTNLILSSAMYHSARAKSLGWGLAEIYEPSADNSASGCFIDVWPYWMDRSDAVTNTFELNGMWILTAPNMAGKSTILRSTAAAALLSVCGLCAPVGPGSKVRRFDHIFVRGASSDVPSESKSAFGAEMTDIAALLRACGSKSLVFVDELGRGTSPRDGTRLAAAVLEEMAERGMSGVFATHLHDILELPLQGSDRIYRKRMAIHEHDTSGKDMDQYTWTYRLEDGVCTDSMALLTALRFGLPQKVLNRAETFSSFLPDSGTALHPLSNNIVNGSVDDDAVKQVNGCANNDDSRMLQVVESLTNQKAVLIPPKWMVPPSLEGESCVYVLQIDNNKYYVGETDNLRQRLKSHRAKGDDWLKARTLAVPIPGGKSDARLMESRLIQSLAKEGFHLESVWDA